jgi:hypothetical protein
MKAGSRCCFIAKSIKKHVVFDILLDKAFLIPFAVILGGSFFDTSKEYIFAGAKNTSLLVTRQTVPAVFHWFHL